MDLSTGDKVRYTVSKSSGANGYQGATHETETETATVRDIKDLGSTLLVKIDRTFWIEVSKDGEPVKGCTEFEVL